MSFPIWAFFKPGSGLPASGAVRELASTKEAQLAAAGMMIPIALGWGHTPKLTLLPQARSAPACRCKAKAVRKPPWPLLLLLQASSKGGWLPAAAQGARAALSHSQARSRFVAWQAAPGTC